MGRLVRKRDGRVASLRSLAYRPRGRDGRPRRAGLPFPDPIAAVTAAQVDAIVDTVLATLPGSTKGRSSPPSKISRTRSSGR